MRNAKNSGQWYLVVECLLMASEGAPIKGYFTSITCETYCSFLFAAHGSMNIGGSIRVLARPRTFQLALVLPKLVLSINSRDLCVCPRGSATLVVIVWRFSCCRAQRWSGCQNSTKTAKKENSSATWMRTHWLCMILSGRVPRSRVRNTHQYLIAQ